MKDIPTLTDSDLGYTGWIEIGQTRIDSFAKTTEDRQWIHVDPELAKDGPFGTTVAHGYLTLSLVSHFLQQLLDVSDSASAVNYGLDRVRFPSPVPVGSMVRGHGHLVEALDVPGGVQVKTRITVQRSDADKPSVVAEVLTRFLSARASGAIVP